jgi:hypothetical protein
MSSVKEDQRLAVRQRGADVHLHGRIAGRDRGVEVERKEVVGLDRVLEQRERGLRGPGHLAGGFHRSAPRSAG